MSDEDLGAETTSRRDALIAAGLFIEDPEQIAGLIFPIPPERSLGNLVREYETKSTLGRKVRCAACKTHTLHYRGFVAELDDGAPALVGIDCGEAHFGKGIWAEMRAKLVREQDRAHYLARLGPALRQIELLHPLLCEWQGALAVWGAFRRDLAMTLPDLNDDLFEAAERREGRLEREKMRKVTVVDEQGRERVERRPETIAYGRIPHPEVFVGAPPGSRVGPAVAALKKAEPGLRDAGNVKAVAGAFAVLREGRRHIEEARALHDRWVRLSEMGWWRSAVEWANSHGGSGKYRIAGRTIVRANDGSPLKVEVPEPDPRVVPLYDTIMAAWPR